MVKRLTFHFANLVARICSALKGHCHEDFAV